MECKVTKESKTDTISDIFYFDVLRFIGISMVIMIHIVSGVINTTLGDNMNDTKVAVYTLIKNIMTPGAPIFFMISGALFLDPEKNMPARKVFGKYLRRIIIALALFGTGFAFIELVADNGNISVSYISEAFVRMLCGNTWAHMWYMYALAGLYMLVPLIRLITCRVSEKIYLIILAFVFLITSVLPYILSIYNIMMPRYGIYLFYFMAGLYAHKYAKKGEGVLLNWILVILMAFVIGIISFLYPGATQNGTSLFYMDYASPIIVLYSLAIFLLVRKMKAKVQFMTKMRKQYFSVYLVHTFFINLAYKFLGITPLMCGGYILLPVFFVAVFILSLLTAWILTHIPVINRYVV